jgi:hypothetical protein
MVRYLIICGYYRFDINLLSASPEQVTREQAPQKRWKPKETARCHHADYRDV